MEIIFFQLPKNDGENHIHGGIGTDMKVWNFKLKIPIKNLKLIFSFFDSDGDNGYPGNMKLHVTYKQIMKIMCHISLKRLVIN